MKSDLIPDLRQQARTYFRILTFVKPYLSRLIIGIIASMIAGMFGFSPVILLNYLLDHVLPSRNPEYLYVFCIVIVGAYLIRGIADYTQSYLMSWIGQNVVLDLRVMVFRHLESMPLEFYRKTRTGDLITRVISDIGLVELGVSRVLSRIVLSMFSLFPPLIAVFYLSWKLAVISVFVLPVLLYPILRFAQKLKKASTLGQKQMAHLTSTMSETFYGIQIVKAFNMEDIEQQQFDKAARAYYNQSMKAARVSALSPPLMEIIGAVAAAIVFGLGLQEVLQGTMTTGNLFSYIASLFLMYDPIKKLSSVNYDIQRAVAGAERLFEILDSQNTILESADPVRPDRLVGRIRFENVTFDYGDGEPVLKDINLEIDSGRTVAVVGVSGAGKSTLANLIPRFFDVTKGRIVLDDHNLRDYSIWHLRENIGLVTQETILFNMPVAMNISFGRLNFSKDQIIEAARAAHAHEFIENLPEGYETLIGERGVTLSGGQRQRLAIARAILKNPPILILDEATSSLDSESEKLIQKALDRLIKNRTTIIIAHRLSTIHKADIIVVLEKGRIVETGTHENLMNTDGHYKKMIELQMFLPGS